MQLQDSIGPAMFDDPEGAVVLRIERTWPVITPAWRLMALFEPDSVAAGTWSAGAGGQPSQVWAGCAGWSSATALCASIPVEGLPVNADIAGQVADGEIVYVVESMLVGVNYLGHVSQRTAIRRFFYSRGHCQHRPGAADLCQSRFLALA